jgi:hypothetical protein
MKKIRNGQYVAELQKDGTVTVFFILYGYWFFQDNDEIHRFRQHRLDKGLIGTHVCLFMKAQKYAKASAVSTHKVPVLSGLQVSGDKLAKYLKTSFNGPVDLSAFDMSDGLISGSSWIYLDGDMNKKRNVPFRGSCKEVVVTHGGVFSNPSFETSSFET